MKIGPGYAHRIVSTLRWTTRNVAPDRLKHVPNGTIPDQALFAEVYNHRDMYPDTLQAMKEQGFIDPFEITPEIEKFTQLHVTKLKEELGRDPTELEIVIRLMRVVMPPLSDLTYRGIKYPGLSKAENGLNYEFATSPFTALRKKHGEILPTQLLKAKQREASCRNISIFLTVCLRSTGIKAAISLEENYQGKRHFITIAEINGRKYEIDTECEYPEVKTTSTQASLDHKIIAAFNAIYGFNRSEQLAFTEARETTLVALTINPNNTAAWGNIARANFTAELLTKMACDLEPTKGLVWAKIGDMLINHYKQQETGEYFCRFALVLEPENAQLTNHVNTLIATPAQP